MRTQRTTKEERSAGKKRTQSRQAKLRRRRRLRVFFSCLLVIVLAAGVIVAGYTLLKIENIELLIPEGTSLTEEEAAGHGGIEIGKNLYSFDLEKAAKQLERAYPELEYFKVRRKLPNRVIIEAEKAEVKQSILVEGAYLYVGKSGKILSRGEAEPYEGSIVVYGLSPLSNTPGELLKLGEEQNAFYTQLITAMEEGGLSDIRALDLGDEFSITANYSDYIMIKFGSVSQLDYKIEMLREVIDKLENDEKVILDASISGIVTRRTWYDE